MYIYSLNQKRKMIPLNGEHICRVDAKGRFLLPVAFKSQLASLLQEGFIMKQSIHNPCLELYPKSTWDELYRKIISKLNRFKREDGNFIRAYSAGTKLIEIDSAGRILIPHDLAKFAGITGDVVVAAMMDCLEVWDKASYDGVVSETQTNMPELAERLLGDINLNE